MERSADGDILSSVWNSRRQVVEETAGEEGCNKEIREKSEKSGAEKVSVSGTRKQEEEHKKSVVDHPKSENMETEDLKTDRNSNFRPLLIQRIRNGRYPDSRN